MGREQSFEGRVLLERVEPGVEAEKGGCHPTLGVEQDLAGLFDSVGQHPDLGLGHLPDRHGVGAERWAVQTHLDAFGLEACGEHATFDEVPNGGDLEKVGAFAEMGKDRVAFSEDIAKSAIRKQGYYRIEAKSFDPVAAAEPDTQP